MSLFRESQCPCNEGHLETVACAPAVNERPAWVQDPSKIGRKYMWRRQRWNQVPLKNPVALDLCAHVTLTLRPDFYYFENIYPLEDRTCMSRRGIKTFGIHDP
jgi:hypothetical protein